MDGFEFQKSRVMRAAEMTRRALDRRDQDGVNRWMAQFKVEVDRLTAIKKWREASEYDV